MKLCLLTVLLGLHMTSVVGSAQEPTSSPAPLRFGGKPPTAVLNIAHRGARAFAPENTLPAVEKAVRFGCPLVEIDVHLSRDGELIVVHDDDLIRCSDVRAKFPNRASYAVSEFTAAEIRTLDAGSWFVEQLRLPPAKRQPFLRSLTAEEQRQHISDAELAHFASGKVFHPTLAEVLATADRLGLMVNVEIKTLPRMYPEIAAKVVAAVAAKRMERRVIVSSFDHTQIAEVRRLSPTIATAALVSDRLARPADYLRKTLDADSYNPGCVGDSDSVGFHSVGSAVDPATAATFRELRAAGLGICVWTENDPVRMRALIAVGVTGIFTDYPNRLAEVLAEKAR